MAGQNFHTIHKSELARLTSGSIPRKIVTLTYVRNVDDQSNILHGTYYANQIVRNGYVIIKADKDNANALFLKHYNEEFQHDEDLGFPILAGESLTLTFEDFSNFFLLNYSLVDAKAYILIGYNDN